MSKRGNTEEPKMIIKRLCCDEEKILQNENVEQTEENSFILDDDCYGKIFSYLSIHDKLNLEQVCKKWQNIALDISWNNMTKLDFLDEKMIDYYFNGKIPSQLKLEIILRRCGRYLRELRLSSDFTDQILKTVRIHCYNLTEINLQLSEHSEEFYNDCFTDAFSNMENLKKFILYSVHGNGILKSLSSLSENVAEIRLFMGRYGSKNPSFHSLFQQSLAKFKNLRVLSISKMSLENKTIEVIGQMKKLVHLELMEVYAGMTSSFLPLTNFPELEYLNLESMQNGNEDDEILAELAKNCKKLKHLNISLCFGVRELGLAHVAELENLEVLKINSVMTSDDIKFNRFSKLKILECEGWAGGTDASIKHLLENSPNLELLDARNSYITIKSLILANDLTRGRTNGIVLHFKVDMGLILKFHQSEILSPFLVLEAK